MEVFGFFFWLLVLIFSSSMFMNISSEKQQMEHGLVDDIDSVFTQGDLSTLFADPSEELWNGHFGDQINSTHVELRNRNHTLAPVGNVFASVIDAAGNGYSGSLFGPLGNVSSSEIHATLPPNAATFKNNTHTFAPVGNVFASHTIMHDDAAGYSGLSATLPPNAATFKSDQEQEQEQQQPQPEQQQEQQQQQQEQEQQQQQQQPNGDDDEQQQQLNGDDDDDDDDNDNYEEDEDEETDHFCRLDEPRIHADLRAMRGNRRRFNH